MAKANKAKMGWSEVQFIILGIAVIWSKILWRISVLDKVKGKIG